MNLANLCLLTQQTPGVSSGPQAAGPGALSPFGIIPKPFERRWLRQPGWGFGGYIYIYIFPDPPPRTLHFGFLQILFILGLYIYSPTPHPGPCTSASCRYFSSSGLSTTSGPSFHSDIPLSKAFTSCTMLGPYFFILASPIPLNVRRVLGLLLAIKSITLFVMGY